MMLGQHQKALEDAKTSVKIEPTFVKGHLRAAKCLLAMGEAGSAKQALEAAERVEPQNAQVQTELTSISHFEKFDSEAKAAHDKKDYRRVKNRKLREPLMSKVCRRCSALIAR